MMQEETSLLQTQLTDAIYESLHNHVASNATFLAERLLAQKDSQENRGLLSECYMAENKHYKDCTSQANRYKFAVSCVKIGKFNQAQKAMLGSEFGKPNKNYDLIPNGSYGLYLLGVITEKRQRYGQAKQYFMKALQVNPTLWSAYQKIGKLGENLLPNKIFIQSRMKTMQTKPGSLDASRKTTTTGYNNRKRQQIQAQKMRKTGFGTTNNPQVGGQLVRKKSHTGSTQSQITNIVTLLKKMADGYYQLNAYNCLQAIEQFKKLPPQHFKTGWVLTNVGKAYMQIVRYQQAAHYYQQAFKLEPHRVEGVDYYSSCLWHLKKNVQLCYLAHQSLDKSLYIPQAWIAVGNCFSLQKQHQQALKFFNRAIQLNPFNPYAFSLCGHEYVYNQDFSNAKKMFEKAFSLDVRHYSAWWGQGNIAYKQQRYQRALQNFRKALQINPKNPVLYSFMGMTLAAKREFTQALDYFQRSQKLDPKNGLNKYQKASTLVKLERYDEAIIQLEKLQELMPKQAPIPTLLGQIYRKKGNKDKAHFYFNTALDLESKDTQKIKGFIESLHNSGNDDELDI